MNTKQAIGFTGTGIFLYLTLASLEFTFSRILHESLIWTQGNAILIHALSVYIPVALVIGLFIYSLKWIRRNWEEGKELGGIFKTSIAVYVVVVAFQLGLTLLEGLYQNHAYLDLLDTYRATLNEHYIYIQLLIDTPAWIIELIIIGTLVFKEIKTLHNKK